LTDPRSISFRASPLVVVIQPLLEGVDRWCLLL